MGHLAQRMGVVARLACYVAIVGWMNGAAWAEADRPAGPGAEVLSGSPPCVRASEPWMSTKGRCPSPCVSCCWRGDWSRAFARAGCAEHRIIRRTASRLMSLRFHPDRPRHATLVRKSVAAGRGIDDVRTPDACELLDLFGSVMGPAGALSTAGVWVGRLELTYAERCPHVRFDAACRIGVHRTTDVRAPCPRGAAEGVRPDAVDFLALGAEVRF